MSPAGSGSPSSVAAVQHHADRLDGREAAAHEVEEQLVLARGVVLLHLLDRVHDPVDADEAHDVAGDAARQGDDEVLGPLLQRSAPRQERQLGLVEASGESHGAAFHEDGVRGP